jgi:hypothetical protein
MNYKRGVTPFFMDILIIKGERGMGGGHFISPVPPLSWR